MPTFIELASDDDYAEAFQVLKELDDRLEIDSFLNQGACTQGKSNRLLDSKSWQIKCSGIDTRPKGCRRSTNNISGT
jgi:hypothetical protein